MIRAKTLPHNPDASYLTPTGWQKPGGVFEPFNDIKPPAPPPVQRPSWFKRLWGMV